MVRRCLVHPFRNGHVHRTSSCGGDARPYEKEQPEELQQPPKQRSEQNEEGHLSGDLRNLLTLMVRMDPYVKSKYMSTEV